MNCLAVAPAAADTDVQQELKGTFLQTAAIPPQTRHSTNTYFSTHLSCDFCIGRGINKIAFGGQTTPNKLCRNPSNETENIRKNFLMFH